jgi:hypothetical protein
MLVLKKFSYVILLKLNNVILYSQSHFAQCKGEKNKLGTEIAIGINILIFSKGITF